MQKGCRAVKFTNKVNYFLGFENKRIPINSFRNTNLNYWSLIRQFYWRTRLNKIEIIQKGLKASSKMIIFLILILC